MPTLRICIIALGLLITAQILAAQAADTDPLLGAALAERGEEDKRRDAYRHPAETLIFFRVKPGMTVAEGLPGGGWYTRILANYLGAKGRLYGVTYADRMWSMFDFATPEWIEKRLTTAGQFPEQVASYTHNGITARGFTFEQVPENVQGTVDRVLLVRALHNLNRFEHLANTRTEALASVHSMLKDDGLVGVVQHRAQETADNHWALGNAGYLKQSHVIAMFEEAGFELVAASEINANGLDNPSADDVVWRLPPSLRGGDSDERAANLATGESDRMTLLFRKAE
ncbi:MAG: class I SAM-dependent methyltransferase [Halieaceae bacterium]|nr:class I SAM-dependent methyltransferase [Halieaceae bacterium]